ncbi:acyl-CoA synthetase, partial [Saccharomonospora xinjiangensis]
GCPGLCPGGGPVSAPAARPGGDTLAARRTPDGWLCTGDAGVEGPDGSLRHTGRITADSRD